MGNEIIVKLLSDVASIPTAHNVGTKKVLITNELCESNVTQVATGELIKGEVVEEHQHNTMEEFYFINEGTCVFLINGIDYRCSPGTFLKIPAKANHSLSATSDLKFIYWGVAV